MGEPGAFHRFRRLLLAVVIGAIAASAPLRAQQKPAAAPPYPPSNFELRLHEHQARQAERKAQLAERAESRLRRLTGSGEAAGTEAATASGSSGFDFALPVKAIIAGIIALAATTAFADDAIDDAGGGSGVSSPVSTN